MNTNKKAYSDELIAQWKTLRECVFDLAIAFKDVKLTGA
jgi:hypothetical protein